VKETGKKQQHVKNDNIYIYDKKFIYENSVIYDKKFIYENCVIFPKTGSLGASWGRKWGRNLHFLSESALGVAQEFASRIRLKNSPQEFASRIPQELQKNHKDCTRIRLKNAKKTRTGLDAGAGSGSGSGSGYVERNAAS